MRNSKSYIVGFLADSVLKISTEADIFIKQPKNVLSSYFLVDSLVQCCPEKVNLTQKFQKFDKKIF